MNKIRYCSILFTFLLHWYHVNAQTSITLNKYLGQVSYKTDFYINKISKEANRYRIDFYFFNNSGYGIGVKVDNIYIGDLEEVKVTGITLGKNHYIGSDNLYFSVEFPVKRGALTLKGVGDYRKDFIINPEEYDKYFVKRSSPDEEIDKSTPNISIQSPELSNNIFRTQEHTVIIQGKATDPEGIASVLINGKPASLKAGGDFVSRIKVKIGKNIVTIKAIDINDNESKQEIIVFRDEFVDDTELSDVDLAPQGKKKNNDAVGIVFGIEEYQYAPKVKYAYNDAEIFREYLVNTFGFKRENIYFRTNERATKGEFEKAFSKDGWIASNTKNNSDVVVFIAGHGAPDLKTQNTYLIPYDVDPNYASTGYSLLTLFNNLNNLKVKSINVFLDVCFSGIGRDNTTLLADSRPIHIKIKNEFIADSINIFASATGNQVSSSWENKKHGIFTYYILSGLQGEADQNQDKKITITELEMYILEKIPEQAKKLGREQTPVVKSKRKEQILLEY